jgi:glucose-6-phosphate isomerase
MDIMNNTTIKLPNRSLDIELIIPENRLRFSSSIVIEKKAGKSLDQMRSLMYNAEQTDDEPLYEFYVGVFNKENSGIFAHSGLRYDIILVFPGHIGGEFKKTSGHIHKQPSNYKTGYPEIYEVLYGTALFMVQKTVNGAVYYAAAIETQAGEKILIPPGYEHATINIGSGPLVFCDLISNNCENEYHGIQDHGGMGYFVISHDGLPEFVKNPRYGDLPEIRRLRPVINTELNITFNEYVYDLLTDNPHAFSYLDKPDMKEEAVRYLADLVEKA